MQNVISRLAIGGVIALLSSCASEKEKTAASLAKARSNLQETTSTAQLAQKRLLLSMAGQEEYLGVKTTTAQASKDFETTSKEVETAVSLSFSQTLKYCQSYIDPIKHKINNDKTNQAYTNATFGVITLLGSVAGYAPVKTVLVGLGVSGSSNGSVSTTVSNYYSDATGDDFNELLARQTKLTELLDKYGKDPYSKDTDPTGNNRGTLLIMMSAACDGTIILPSDPSRAPI